MSELKGQPAVVQFTLTIKRAATGVVETYEMVGHIDKSKPEEQINVSNAQHSE